MEWLVNVRIKVPYSAPAGEVADRVRRETELADRFAAAGHIVRLWRIPGEWANWGLWSASDATELHRLLSQLPLHEWADVTVHPLAEHPNDPTARGVSEGN